MGKRKGTTSRGRRTSADVEEEGRRRKRNPFILDDVEEVDDDYESGLDDYEEEGAVPSSYKRARKEDATEGERHTSKELAQLIRETEQRERSRREAPPRNAF